MIIHCADDKKRKISLTVGTGTKFTTGKEYIFCELSYYDKKTGSLYNKVFPSTKFDEISKRFYAIYNEAIPAAEIPGLFK